MKKITKELVEVETAFCNICQKEMGERSIYNRTRQELVHGILKTADFDAHEACMNNVIREAFAPYAEVRAVGRKKKNT